MNGFKNLLHEFTDNQNRKYYKFAPGTIPFFRHQQRKELLIWLQTGSSRDEYLKLIGYAQEAFAEGYKQRSKIAAVLNELEFRVNTIDPDIVYQIMAVGIIREDEDPHVYSLQIQEEKAKLFKEDLSDEMQFFFALKPWISSLTKLPPTKEVWKSILINWQKETQRRKNLNLALQGDATTLSI